MRFLARNRNNSRHSGYALLKSSLIILAIAYSLSSIWLYLHQERLLYRPNQSLTPFAPQDFQLDHQNVWITIPDAGAKIHGWWFDAPATNRPVVAIANEPRNILTIPKTMLYFCGRGGSKTHYNNLARIQAFQQLGFSVLAIDYRGYGLSEGNLPNEARLYADSQAAWAYLVGEKRLKPQDIVIYGESLGGAVAIDLALKQPQAAGLIVQSSFTDLSTQVKDFYPFLSIFPLNLILHQRFDSIAKVRQLAVPVLFLHGTADTIVNSAMSGELYDAASEPKTLFYIPGAEHLRLYQPEHSYLSVIKDFVLGLEAKDN